MVNGCITKGVCSDSTKYSAIQVYQNLQSLPFDNSRISIVENLALEKDRAKIIMKKGTLYLAKPVAGKVTGAIFVGDGVFELKPPNEIEKAQVRRFLKKDSLNENFKAAYLRFTDETAKELHQRLKFRKGEIPKKIPNMHNKITKYFLEERKFNISSRILGDLLNASKNGLFFAILEHKDKQFNFSNFFMFALDPQAIEEVTVFQYFPRQAKKPFYTLCSFHQLSDYDADNVEYSVSDEEKDILQITHYAMNLEIEKSGKIIADVELTYKPIIDSLRVLTFTLFKELKIDSVKSESGDTLAFIKEEKEASFSVLINKTTKAGINKKLQVYYSGKALERANGNLFLKDNLNWYPRFGYLIPATYDMTFKYPKNWQVLAVGEKIKQWEEPGFVFSRWVEEVPSLAAAFAFGIFDSTEYAVLEDLPIKVFSTRKRSKSMRKKIGGDVANSLYIFQSLLGNYPYSQLNVVETPSLTSHGYPGILFLTWLTFDRELQGVMEALRGHEVAHQWWGNLIGWRTYHDQWLSEGFAEYSGAMVAQMLLDGDKTFFQILKGWKTDLLDKGHIGVSIGLRRFGFSKADLSQSDGLKAGPIWLGGRLGDRFPVDYYLNIYEKGAYVLHMLRTLMRDFDTGSDIKFWNMLADFVNTYQGKKATTEDFKNVLEKHIGQNMDWFFDQWVYGIDVPNYVYSYEITNVQEEFWVNLEVHQENVSPEFKMYIPVGVELAKEVKTTQLILMQGVEKTFRLGPFNRRPQRVIFNDFEGVLARFKVK